MRTRDLEGVNWNQTVDTTKNIQNKNWVLAIGNIRFSAHPVFAIAVLSLLTSNILTDSLQNFFLGVWSHCFWGRLSGNAECTFERGFFNFVPHSRRSGQLVISDLWIWIPDHLIFYIFLFVIHLCRQDGLIVQSAGSRSKHQPNTATWVRLCHRASTKNVCTCSAAGHKIR